jgi:GNAT superfamily N-acetyltransferase
MDVVELSRPRTGPVAAVMSRAFADNPMTVHCVPDESSRADKLTWFFGVALRCGVAYGTVHTTAEGEGAAIWLPPGATSLGVLQLARQGFLTAPFRIGMGPLRRLFGALNHFERLHERLQPSPHWFLFLMGVDPPLQGRGIGSRLMQPGLRSADEAGLPCYLETDKEINVRFYAGHHFEVVHEGDVPGGGFHFWTMRRAPR